MNRASSSPTRTPFAILAFVLLLVDPGAVRSAASAPDQKSREEAVIEELLKLPAPPPDWRDHLKRRAQKPAKPPPADASLEAVSNYWRTAPETAAPDDATRARLLEACEHDPNRVSDLLRWLAIDSRPVQERLKAIHDQLAANPTREAAEATQLLKRALMHHGDYFREELIRRAFRPGDIGEDEAVEAMTDLIRLNRNSAKEILLQEAIGSDLQHRAIAISALMQNFGTETDPENVGRWRDALKQIASDKKAPIEARRPALLQVASDHSAETASWFLSLFREQTLNVPEKYLSRSTPLGDVVEANPDYWIPKVVPLVGNKDPATHSSAVNALIQFHIDKARADALRPLLPWIDNPAWAPHSEEILGRLRLLQSLDRVNLPESVPALLKVAASATGYELDGVAAALAHYNAREAIEPLKRAFARERDPYHRWRVTDALLQLNGFSRKELVDSLKQYALKISTAAGRAEIEKASELLDKTVIDPRVSIGQEIERRGLSDDAVSSDVLSAADELATSNPAAADSLRQFVAKWKTPNSIKAVVGRLRSGELTAAWVQQLVEERAKLSDSLGPVRNLKGGALGVQAGVTGDSALIQTILAGNDQLASRALLAVARLGRVDLPIPEVAKFLQASEKNVVHAAELYLEANDSAPAREVLWTHFKDQARIIGSPDFSDWPGGIHGSELQAQGLVSSKEGPREILALLSNVGDSFLLVYPDRTVLRRDEGNGRAREREVSAEEFTALRRWLDEEQVDDLPMFDTGTADGVQYEYLRLSRAGGRRVYMNNPPGTDAAPRVEFGDQRPGPDPRIYGELTARLNALSEAPMKVSYPALERMPGFRVVHAREQGEITGVAVKNGKPAASIKNNQKDTLEWHFLSADGLSHDFTEEMPSPDDPEWSDLEKAVMLEEGPLIGNRLVPDWLGEKRESGLWAVQKNKKPELIARGIFSRPVVCPGGEWIVVAKTPNYDMWNTPNGVVRINLHSKRMFPVNLPRADNFNPLAWIAAHQRVLLHRQRDDPRYLPARDKPDPDAGPEKPEFYLLDPTNGETKRIVGEFRPLQRLEGHELQATGTPNEFWAVIVEKEDDPKPTSVLGRYGTHEFRFTEALRLPAMWFNSWDVHVDEPAGAVWIAVNGDLLRLSLPSTAE